MKDPQDLLYDSEASLRLVDRAVAEMTAPGMVADKELRWFITEMQQMQNRMRGVSSQAERASSEIFAGIGRALALLERLESREQSPRIPSLGNKPCDIS